MADRPGDRRLRLPLFLGVAVYAFFLVTAPFQHHDLACHLKTPQHCSSCSSSQVGSDPNALAPDGSSYLADAGRALTFHAVASDTLLPVRSTGRSPPAQA